MIRGIVLLGIIKTLQQFILKNQLVYLLDLYPTLLNFKDTFLFIGYIIGRSVSKNNVLKKVEFINGTFKLHILKYLVLFLICLSFTSFLNFLQINNILLEELEVDIIKVSLFITSFFGFILFRLSNNIFVF